MLFIFRNKIDPQRNECIKLYNKLIEIDCFLHLKLEAKSLTVFLLIPSTWSYKQKECGFLISPILIFHRSRVSNNFTTQTSIIFIRSKKILARKQTCVQINYSFVFSFVKFKIYLLNSDFSQKSSDKIKNRDVHQRYDRSPKCRSFELL